MNLTYNAFFGIVLLIFSIIIIVPTIQFVSNFSNYYEKKEFYEIYKTINNLKPYEYKKVEIPEKEGYIILYNPIHQDLKEINNKPFNFKMWKDYYSYSCSLENVEFEDYSIRVENENFCFYSISSVKPKDEGFLNILKDYYEENCHPKEFEIISFFILPESLLSSSFSVSIIKGLYSAFCIGLDIYLKKVMLKDTIFKPSAFAYSYLSDVEKRRETKELIKRITKKKFFYYFKKRMVSRIVFTYSIKFLVRSTKKLTFNIIPIVGSLISISSSAYEFYSTFYDIRTYLNKLDEVVVGFFGDFIEKNIEFFHVTDKSLLNFYQNYLFLGKLENNNEVSIIDRKKLNDKIAYVTGDITLLFPSLYENAFDLKSYYVVNLPIDKDAYLIFLLTDKTFYKMKELLDWINSKNIEKLSKYGIIINKKLEAYIVYKLPLQKNKELDYYLDKIYIFYPYLNESLDNSTFEQLKNSIKNYDFTYMKNGLIIMKNEESIDEKLEEALNNFKELKKYLKYKNTYELFNYFIDYALIYLGSNESNKEKIDEMFIKSLKTRNKLLDLVNDNLDLNQISIYSNFVNFYSVFCKNKDFIFSPINNKETLKLFMNNLVYSCDYKLNFSKYIKVILFDRNILNKLKNDTPIIKYTQNYALFINIKNEIYKNYLVYEDSFLENLIKEFKKLINLNNKENINYNSYLNSLIQKSLFCKKVGC